MNINQRSDIAIPNSNINLSQRSRALFCYLYLFLCFPFCLLFFPYFPCLPGLNGSQVLFANFRFAFCGLQCWLFIVAIVAGLFVSLLFLVFCAK